MKKILFVIIILTFTFRFCGAQISRVFRGHSGYAETVAFSPGGKYIAGGGMDGLINIWDIGSGEIVNSIKVNDNAFKLCFSSDSRNICASTAPLNGISQVPGRFIFVYNTFNGNMNPEPVINCKSPDFFFNAGENKIITIIPELTLDSCKYSYDYDFKRYAETKCYRLLLNKYDLSSKICDSNIFIDYIASWDFNSPYVISGNGKFLAICSYRGEDKSQTRMADNYRINSSDKTHKNFVSVFDIENKKLLSQANFTDGYPGNKDILLTNDGSYFIYPAKQYFYDVINILDLKGNEEVRTLKGHSDEILCLAIHPGGKYIASGSKDNTIRIWNINTGKELAVLKGHSDNVNFVTFSADGRFLASASDDKTVRVLDLSPLIGDIEFYSVNYYFEKGLKALKNEERNDTLKDLDDNEDIFDNIFEDKSYDCIDTVYTF